MIRFSKLTRKRLGELLIEEGLVTETQIEEALVEQKKTGGLLGEVLIDLGFVTEVDIARAMSTQFGLPFIHVGEYQVGPDLKEIFSQEVLERNQIVPMDCIGDMLLVATAGTLNADLVEELIKISRREISFYVTTVSDVRMVQKKVFGFRSETAIRKKSGESTDTRIKDLPKPSDLPGQTS